MDILKIATAGSVDDGKSTLIGRLLYETNSLKDDQLEHIEHKSKSRGYDYMDFSLATDGLLTEREQGITIDVSHIYFSTPKRRFIIADSPGHEEYTRNMITGASTSQAAIILLDARKGVIKQTKRHFYITQLLGIKHIVVAINKMDLVDYSEERYFEILKDFQNLNHSFGIATSDIRFIPISALAGDNIVSHSENMSWYKGSPLLEILESIDTQDNTYHDNVLQVQYVIRPRKAELHDYRGFAGKMRSGVLEVGDEIKVFPSGRVSKIKSIEKYGESINTLAQNENGTILLEDEVDISRGDTVISKNSTVQDAKIINANVCWMQSESLVPGKMVFVQQGIHRVKGKIKQVINKINLETLETSEATELNLNDIGEVQIQLANPILNIPYSENNKLGTFIIIDELSNNTAGAGFLN
ncbi:MAG: sulfate adenylyltransferase [Flavobacteriales bacterium]|nr:sulfate adenylyltransferase [Flavobacteriales bacterium]